MNAKFGVSFPLKSAFSKCILIILLWIIHIHFIFKKKCFNLIIVNRNIITRSSVESVRLFWWRTSTIISLLKMIASSQLPPSNQQPMNFDNPFHFDGRKDLFLLLLHQDFKNWHLCLQRSYRHFLSSWKNRAHPGSGRCTVRLRRSLKSSAGWRQND